MQGMVFAGLDNVARMARRSKELEKTMESDRRLQKTRRDLKVSGSAIFEAQNLASSKMKDIRLCRKLLGGVKEQHGLGSINVKRVDVARSKAAI